MAQFMVYTSRLFMGVDWSYQQPQSSGGEYAVQERTNFGRNRSHWWRPRWEFGVSKLSLLNCRRGPLWRPRCHNAEVLTLNLETCARTWTRRLQYYSHIGNQLAAIENRHLVDATLEALPKSSPSPFSKENIKSYPLARLNSFPFARGRQEGWVWVLLGAALPLRLTSHNKGA